MAVNLILLKNCSTTLSGGGICLMIMMTMVLVICQVLVICRNLLIKSYFKEGEKSIRFNHSERSAQLDIENPQRKDNAIALIFDSVQNAAIRKRKIVETKKVKKKKKKERKKLKYLIFIDIQNKKSFCQFILQ